MPDTYSVEQGDSIPSIAKGEGFFWKTLWNHGNNASLKNQRKNPNVLFPGDSVYIPDLEAKQESRGEGSRYRFRRKGEPVKLIIKLLKPDGKPRANVPYVLTVAGKDLKGSTDGEGVLKEFIPNDAKEGKLSLENGAEVFPVIIGGLDPVDEITGVQQRLSNLGFDCEETGEMDDQTERAVESFQSSNGMQSTGKIDDALKQKLMQLTQ